MADAAAAGTGVARLLSRLFFFAGGRVVGLVLLVALAGLQAAELPAFGLVRTAWFDLYQWLSPRVPAELPAVIVDIDEDALAAYGQWPWPRTRLAKLIDRVAAAGPAAIGLDIVFAEADQTSPAQLVDAWPGLDASTRERLRSLPSNDQVLGNAIAAAGVVVGKAAYQTGDTASKTPGHFAPVRRFGDWKLNRLVDFKYVVPNLPAVENRARAWGLLAAMPTEDGVVRRALAFGRSGQTVLASLPIEMIRAAVGAKSYGLAEDKETGELIAQIGDSAVYIDGDGGLNLHHSRHDPRRYFSAKRVLDSDEPPAYLRNRFVIIAVTALGLRDFVDTPTEHLMPGAEIHAQVLESLLQGSLLQRPTWTKWAELAMTVAGGALLIWLVPALSPWLSFAPLMLLWSAGGLLGWFFFIDEKTLLDASVSGLNHGLVFVAMLGITLILAEQRRREIQDELEREQRAAQILQGQLDAARDIQMSMLPDPGRAGLPAAVDLDARLVPARTVGGDLYDFFMIDERRLFFHIGDVTGKGVDAALFMALSKALCKSVVLRHAGAMDRIMAEANAELARENIADMMVTMFAGILDLETGVIEFCNAGHEAPYRLRPGGTPVEIESEGGPPLCALDEFDYPLERTELGPGEMLVLYTDGVTDAVNPADEMFGRVRLAELFASMDPGAGAGANLQRLFDQVDGFVAGADAADDITVVVLRRASS